MNLLSNPLFDALAEARSILVAGADGGFDVYSGLPLYFVLRDAGKVVYLANFSFASLIQDSESVINDVCMKVMADSSGSETRSRYDRLPPAGPAGQLSGNAMQGTDNSEVETGGSHNPGRNSYCITDTAEPICVEETGALR